jgi:hypothetical protein
VGKSRWLPALVRAGAFCGLFNFGLGSGLGGLFLLAMDLHTWALFNEQICLPLIGEESGNNFESILFISLVSDL